MVKIEHIDESSNNNNPTTQVQLRQPQLTHEDRVVEHVQKVSLYTSAGLMTTAFTSGTILALLPPPTMSNITSILYEWKTLSSLLGISSVMALVGTLGVSFTRPKIIQGVDEETGETYPVELNSNWRHFFAGSLFVSTGVLLSPLLYYANGLNPYIVPTAFVATGASTLGMMSFAMTAKRSQVLALRAPLHVMMWGLLGVGILQYFYPENTVIAAANQLGCIGAFSLYTAYDVHQTMQEYEQGEPDTVNSAVSFYWNIISVFSNLVRLLTNTQSSKKKRRSSVY